MKTKRIISIILALIISCQSLSLNVFANNAEIEDILSNVSSTAQTLDDYTRNTSDYEEIGEELPPSYDELAENADTQVVPDIIADGSFILDQGLPDTVSERTSALLDIDYASAQRMIAAYGSEEMALSEAENYAELERIFYALDYPDIKDKLIELLVSGYGSQRVAYSGIVAIVLDADIEEVILKNSDVIPDDIYTEYLAQQLFVSPSFVASYTLETGLSTEVMYHLVLSALQEMYPSVFGATIVTTQSV